MSMRRLTYRIALNDLALLVVDYHDLLRLEGDEQHRTLLHHLTAGQVYMFHVEDTRAENVAGLHGLTSRLG